jgi:hypothetical protein
LSFEDFISDSDENPRPRKVVLYGTHGIGKSSWAAACPFGPVVFLPTEDGYHDLRPKVKVLTFHGKKTLESEGELLEAIAMLAANEHPFGCVVVDSAEAALKNINASVVKAAESPKVKSVADIGFGKGQAAAAAKFEYLLTGLDSLNARGMFVIVLAHADIERFNDPTSDPYDRYTLRLDKRISPMLQEWADEVLFANYRVYTKKTDEGFGKVGAKAIGNGERVLYTTERPTHDAKNRLGLPDEMGLDWATYQQAVSGEVVEV